MFLGQEDHAHAVLAGRGQRDALRGHLGAVEVVGNLDQDAGAVAHQLVRAHGAAMVEVLEDLEPLLDDRVILLALDVCDEAHATGIVLACRVVEAARLHAAQRDQGGLWRFSDSSLSIFDGSLLIAHGTQGPDTTVFLHFNNRATNGQTGFRALSDLVRDTTAYRTGTGNATATACLGAAGRGIHAVPRFRHAGRCVRAVRRRFRRGAAG